MRKAQFTIFIILGLVLVLIIGLSLFNFTRTSSDSVHSENFEPLNLYLEACFENSIKQSIPELFLNNFFHLRQDRSYVYSSQGINLRLPYLVYYDTPYYLTKEAVSQRLSNVVRTNFQNCISVNEIYSMGYIEFILNNVSSNVEIEDNLLLFDISIDAMQVATEDSMRDSWSSNKNLNYPLGYFLTGVNEFVLRQSENDFFLLSNLIGVARNLDFTVELVQRSDAKIVTFILDDYYDNLGVDNMRAIFVFSGVHSEVSP